MIHRLAPQGVNLFVKLEAFNPLPEGLKVGGKIFGGPKPPRGSVGAEAARTLRYLVVRYM
jgi:hypothetical protein